MERHPGKPAEAVVTTRELEKTEIAVVEKEFGPGVFKSAGSEAGPAKAPQINILRRYGTAEPEWSININVPNVFDFLLLKCGFEPAQALALKAAPNTEKLIELLAQLPASNETQQKLLTSLRSYGTVTARVKSVLSESFPKFMYFSNYDRMEGAVQIEDLLSLKASGEINADGHKGQRLFMEFLEYAGVPLSEILGVATYETFNAKIQAASNNITDQILEYWAQNPDLSVKVDIDAARTGDRPPLNTGTVARARIYNNLHRVDTPFSERSAGFVWFFSFLVKFAQVKSEGRPVILLLDEPGLTLHGKAQGDLLRYFDEKLAGLSSNYLQHALAVHGLAGQALVG